MSLDIVKLVIYPKTPMYMRKKTYLCILFTPYY